MSIFPRKVGPKMTLGAIALSLGGLLFWRAMNRKTDTEVRTPPGSLGLPFIGETFLYASNPHKFFETRRAKYGPVFKTRILGRPVVCFTGPEAFDFFVTAPHFDREGASPGHVQGLLYHHSLPLVDGATHKKMRDLVLQAFTPRVVETYIPIIQRITDRYLQRWEHARDITWIPEHKKMSASICEALLTGADTGADNDSLVEMLDSFNSGLTALPIKLPWTKFGKAMNSRDQLLNIIDDAISAHRQESYQDMLAELLKARSEDGSDLEEDQLRAQMAHMFFAGYGNIYRVLTLFCMSLAQNPEVMERARQEVLRLAPEGPLDQERLGHLTFLDQVTKEVRRHNRVFASTFFDWVKEPFDYQDYHIPKGWKATGGIYTTMQDADAFAHPDQFNADRFRPDGPENGLQDKGYVPQGGGSMEGHRCPAEDMTTVLMKIVGVLLLRTYTWELPPQDMELDNEPSPLPRDGLKVIFRRHPLASALRRSK